MVVNTILKNKTLLRHLSLQCYHFLDDNNFSFSLKNFDIHVMMTHPTKRVSGLNKIDETKNSIEPNQKSIRLCLVQFQNRIEPT